ncbi:NAD-P-binding protein [Epithele typhae]|uniref:NAD-P-binding protein n=1 Tax=Epithele typhae TaxID=378194 RepID=UPI002008C0CD|nr:NAD-P-binding protein [Epithele typhae]KAH9916607.1 NAD-P-binding protein [Epithele typhae]
MPSYAIIGASRGIGLEYVRQLVTRPGDVVFAVVRSAATSTHLQAVASAFANVHILEGEVTDYASLQASRAATISDINHGELDCLIHSAAKTDLASFSKGYDSFATMDELDDDFIRAFKVNALGFIHAVQAFLPLLRASRSPAGKRIVALGSVAVDPKFIRTTRSPDCVAYGMTKSAELIAATKWAMHLDSERFVVVSLSPGLVDSSQTLEQDDRAAIREWFRQTGESYVSMGLGDLRAQTVEESVSAQLRVIDGLRQEDNGKFFAHTGEEL